MDTALIDTLKAWARANYQNGGDIMVECWGDAEWAEHIAEHGDNSLSELILIAQTLKDYGDDIRASAF